MPRPIAIVGAQGEGKTAVLEKLVSELTRRGMKVGVAVHKVISGPVPGEEEEVKRYTRAGAFQVLVTRGKEIGTYTKQGGLTPLTRLAARYFNAVDILLADGYLDPVPKIEVCLADDPRMLRCLGDPNLLAVVFHNIRPVLPAPAFTDSSLGELAEHIFLLNEDRIKQKRGHQNKREGHDDEKREK